MLIWSYQGAEIAPGKLFTDAGNIVTFARDFFPPDFHEWRYYLEELVVTLHIAIWGTLLAVICAVPLGLLASSNITPAWVHRSEEHTSELQSLMRISYAVFCLKKKKKQNNNSNATHIQIYIKHK